MSATISIAIEGPDANRALDEFLAIDGIVGEARPAERGPVTRDDGVLTAIGAIVGFAGTIASIVSSIIEWREKMKQSSGGERLSVAIEDAKGNRISLDHATPEQITAVLQTLHS
jgi:hypothetical protein